MASSPVLWVRVALAGLVTLLGISVSLAAWPSKHCGLLPRRVRLLRSLVLGQLRWFRHITTQGPFYRLMVWLGLRLGRGRLSSRCRPPNFKVKPIGCTELQVTIEPHSYLNPFHEENYMLSWHKHGEMEPSWRTKLFHCQNDCQKVDKVSGRLRTTMHDLPDHQDMIVRLSAVGFWGQSDWSRSIRTRTLARPADDGSFHGPLGPAIGGDQRYTWKQSTFEVHVKIPLMSCIRARDIRFKCTGSRLDVQLTADAAGGPESPTEVLSGPLFGKVKTDEAFWTIEDDDPQLGRHMAVQMIKAEEYEKWRSLLTSAGHPQIDTRYLRFLKENVHGLALD